jgi:4-amino-4-deoxy-L-arabinose transferase-like glycosyltransferase
MKLVKRQSQSRNPQYSEKFLICIGFLFVFAFALRIHYLDHESLFMDELHQVSYYSNSFSQIVFNAASMAQPPLDYWIGKIVYRLSDSDFAVRLPSAIFGSGAVLILACLVAKICSWPMGIIAGGISAILPFNLYYSQHARPYAIAIFFFLAVMWVLGRCLDFDIKGYSNQRSCSKESDNLFRIRLFSCYLSLVFITTLFLYSRTLSPLVVVVVIEAILAFFLLIHFIVDKYFVESQRSNCVIAFAGFFTAIMLYIPGLMTILSTDVVGNWADTSLELSPQLILGTLKNFDFFPIWQSFIVQTEPLGWVLLLLLCLSPYFIWREYQNSLLSIICLFLLPCAVMLNLFIFRAKSPHVHFRPPYAIYILPLTVILSSISVQGLWNLLKNRNYMMKALLISGLVASFATAGYAMVDFKRIQKNTDWRSLGAYLNERLTNQNFIVFDALSAPGGWEPNFYAFPRYYRKPTKFIRMKNIFYAADQVLDLSYQPVIVFFEWREYFLTSHSRYPIMPIFYEGLNALDFWRIASDPALNTASFKGLFVIQLEHPSGNSAEDLYQLTTILLSYFPKDPRTVDVRLAAAGLSRALNLPEWKKHWNIASSFMDESASSKK